MQGVRGEQRLEPLSVGGTAAAGTGPQPAVTITALQRCHRPGALPALLCSCTPCSGGAGL